MTFPRPPISRAFGLWVPRKMNTYQYWPCRMDMNGCHACNNAPCPQLPHVRLARLNSGQDDTARLNVSHDVPCQRGVQTTLEPRSYVQQKKETVKQPAKSPASQMIYVYLRWHYHEDWWCKIEDTILFRILKPCPPLELVLSPSLYWSHLQSGVSIGHLTRLFFNALNHWTYYFCSFWLLTIGGWISTQFSVDFVID